MSRQQPVRAGLVHLTLVWLACFAGQAGAATAAYPILGREAPDFALHSSKGPNVRLSEYRGEVVVISFWGSRCATCGAQLQALERSYRTFRPAGLEVLGVNVDDDQRRAEAAAGGYPVQFPILLDPSKSVSREYRVDNLPMTLLVDRDGQVRYVHRDFSKADEALYLEELRGLLNE